MSSTGALEKIAKSKNVEESIRTIAEYTSNGFNLFKGKMNDDASVMDSDLIFASEEVKNWVK